MTEPNWSSVRNAKPDCVACKGSGKVGGEQYQPCARCCLHDEGWWDLTPGYYMYKRGADNRCCVAGCGTLARDLK